MTQEKDKRINNRLCMLVALMDIFVIKLFSYDLKDDHTFILQTSASTNDTKNTFISPITSIGKLNEVE
jgi:hypothetical protein